MDIFFINTEFHGFGLSFYFFSIFLRFSKHRFSSILYIIAYFLAKDMIKTKEFDMNSSLKML
ncbi:hypothetical protein D3Z45_07210 [Lachnospiraceae bacterium]|nr:hypothetical protein [Lachnospiraceae bacterium]